MPDNNSNKNQNSQTQIILALIGLFGTVGVARTRLVKSILDCAWGAFLVILQAVVVKRGKQTLAVETRGSSIECSGCGARVEKTLDVRVHSCSRGQ
ncbi:zinc ribbon domain-containing protein [Gloeocapsopsis dulcis]|uniref:Cas12f1-like TNB domain-containing protein n=1 Tax=Gloeocapsopsis dulcis AAB1 = 1H9 TaxID=1433147 RepID=A0A6N8G203_9CHRO|nr:zinc ribbon domain-containing protein [Gloeocapsopsis dulcis]MUL38994.1 hypothetical protein [Gloeocapsopsis dulcis AAB1 = 1H9]WNN90826.1 zinc ribbon domain-containing protein [Gloeocapsopsis dulcis]